MRKLLFLPLIFLCVNAAALDTGNLDADEQYAFEIDPNAVDWVNPENAETSNDSYATATYDAGFGVETVPTNYLYLTVYGASIPSDATIDGIEVKVERKCDE